jgi:hypothetical protein
MIYIANGIYCENVLHFRRSAPYDAAALTDLRTIADNWHNTSWKAALSNQTGLVRIRTKALDSLGSPMEEYALAGVRYGSQGFAPYPNSVSFCVKIATGLTGRSYRGRYYVIGVCNATAFVSGNQVVAGQVTDYVSRLNTLKTNTAASGHTLGVMSYMSGGNWRAAGLFTPATGFVAVDSYLDTQRRRLK